MRGSSASEVCEQYCVWTGPLDATHSLICVREPVGRSVGVGRWVWDCGLGTCNDETWKLIHRVLIPIDRRRTASCPYIMSMIQGERVRLHPETVCEVDGSNSQFGGSRCVILGFDTATSKWRAKLLGRDNEAEMLFAESELRLGYSVLPSAVERLKYHAEIITEDAQGACGRGITVGESVPAHAPLFEEPPFLVVYSDPGEANLNHFAERWRAYSALADLTMAHDASDVQAAAVAALAGFDDLAIASAAPPAELKDAAEKIVTAEEQSEEAALMSPAARAEHVEEVVQTLRRFRSNAFGFKNGAESGDADRRPFRASAVLSFTSRTNHSCAPTCFMLSKPIYCKGKRLPALASDADVLIAVTQRPMSPGERITFNYGPSELVSKWPLAQRRAWLLKHFGFTCSCEKCTIETAIEERMRGGGEGGGGKGAAAASAAAAGSSSSYAAHKAAVTSVARGGSAKELGGAGYSAHKAAVTSVTPAKPRQEPDQEAEAVASPAKPAAVSTPVAVAGVAAGGTAGDAATTDAAPEQRVAATTGPADSESVTVARADGNSSPPNLVSHLRTELAVEAPVAAPPRPAAAAPSGHELLGAWIRGSIGALGGGEEGKRQAVLLGALAAGAVAVVGAIVAMASFRRR